MPLEKNNIVKDLFELSVIKFLIDSNPTVTISTMRVQIQFIKRKLFSKFQNLQTFLYSKNIYKKIVGKTY